LDTFNIDVNQIEQLITPRTKVILPVHLFGLSADMSPINRIARQHKLFVIEDAACGFGARYDNNHVGSLGTTGCFSFHPRKAITTGEGGMVTCADNKLAEKIRRLRDHGAAVSDLQRHLGARPYLLADHPHAGYNQRMTDIQAALGNAQMDRAEAIVAERQRLANIYFVSLANLGWLQLPTTSSHHVHGYQSFACWYQPEAVKAAVNRRDSGAIREINTARNAWMDELQSAGISTRPATHAVHMLEFYRRKYEIVAEDYIAAFAANDCSLSIPLFHGMTEQEQAYVIEHVRKHQS